MRELVVAIEVAVKRTLPITLYEGGRERVVVKAQHSTLSGRVYLTFADGEEIDVPQMCHLIELR